MILVSFGDELVYGEAAPKNIATENGLNFIDKASPNITSNVAIYKDVIRACVELDNPDDYIFLIGWTKKDRISYRNEGKDIVFQKDKYNHPIKIYDKLNKFNRYLFESVLVNQQLLSLVFAAQQVLESKGIKYYMYNTSDKIDYTNHTMAGLKNLNNRYYHNALSYDSSMKGYLAKQDTEDSTVWSKFLAQKMRAAGVLTQ